MGRGIPFVLVHGGWHGGWCWERVAPRLGAGGHPTLTPTLAGLAERAGEPASLSIHIAEVAAALPDQPVVLVGHSYAGAVITGVAARRPDRIATLVYLDAFVPEHGQCIVDLLPADRRAALLGDGTDTSVPPPPPAFYGVTDPDDAAWVTAQLTPQPMATFTEPLDVDDAAPRPDRVFIRCTTPAVPTFESFARRAQDDPGWRYRTLAAGHDAMITHPAELAQLLLESGAGD